MKNVSSLKYIIKPVAATRRMMEKMKQLEWVRTTT